MIEVLTAYIEEIDDVDAAVSSLRKSNMVNP
jgi:hypothetical protein